MKSVIPPALCSCSFLALDDCETKISEIIRGWPRGHGTLEVAAQRGELAGWIECLAWNKQIDEETRAILNGIYVQGWDRYEAINQFSEKFSKRSKKKIVKNKVSLIKQAVVNESDANMSQ